jgi:uracil-DNA glycosylase
MYEQWEDFFDEIVDVMEGLDKDALLHIDVPVYPPTNQVFDAFEYFDPMETKVVILGQDCYHRKGQAMGLAFSVPPNTKFPPSLRNISREMEIDLGVGLSSGDLTHWANQGVLLLNCALTVREKSPGSHTKIWQSVTNNIVKRLSQTQTNICFLLWGKHAQSKACLIDPNKGHLVLEAGHPSPLSANRGGWFGNGHFSIVNSFLKSIEQEPIVWSDNTSDS